MIGSVADATEQQFIDLYGSVKQVESLDMFLVESKERQEMARKDRAELERLGITPQQIVTKLKVLESQIHPVMRDRRYENPTIPSAPRMLPDPSKVTQCLFCAHKILGDRNCKLQNGPEIIPIPGIFFHMMAAHGYFGTKAPDRFDPIKLCRAIRLI